MSGKSDARAFSWGNASTAVRRPHFPASGSQNRHDKAVITVATVAPQGRYSSA
jgi:hypothetical protein